jgi:hypothetical protein
MPSPNRNHAARCSGVSGVRSAARVGVRCFVRLSRLTGVIKRSAQCHNPGAWRLGTVCRQDYVRQTERTQRARGRAGPAPTAGNHDIAAMDGWERNAGRARQADEAAALRAEAARQRRDEAARRLPALRDGHAGGGTWLETATERAATATEALAVARAHAVDALERSTDAHSASAPAHDHAAETANTLGDDAAATRHQDAAAQAREAANVDRGAADEQRQQN